MRSMKKELEALRHIKALPEPRHLFVIPASINAADLDRLIREGYLTCEHDQRDDKGVIQVAMGLSLTPEGERSLEVNPAWQQLALKGSLAGASMVLMNVVILYLG